MKKVLLAILHLTYTFVTQAQINNDPEPSKATYGFNIGVNYSNLLSNNTFSHSHEIDNKLGYRLGILMDYAVTDIFSFSPKAELSFNNGKYNSGRTSDNITYDVMPVTLDFSAHVTFDLFRKETRPYLLFGPTFRTPIPQDSDNALDTHSDFALDIGLGLDKPLTNFNVAPELRYSAGLMEINRGEYFNAMFMHNITLVINIKG